MWLSSGIPDLGLQARIVDLWDYGYGATPEDFSLGVLVFFCGSMHDQDVVVTAELERKFLSLGFLLLFRCLCPVGGKMACN